MTTEYREREREMSIEKRAEGGGDTERDVKNEGETQQPERLVEPDKTEREREREKVKHGMKDTDKQKRFGCSDRKRKSGRADGGRD